MHFCIFGRSVFVSEIYELVDQVPGVDSVSKVDLNRIEPNIPDRQVLNEINKGLVGLELKPYELVDVKEENVVVNIAKQRD